MHIVLVISSMFMKMRTSAILCAFIATCILDQQVQGVNVDGGWSTWGAYGACSVTCGHGLRTRTRTCTDPEPEGNGLPCPDDSFEETACTPSQSCPVASHIDPDDEKVADKVDKDCAYWRDVGGYNETGVYVMTLNELRPLVKHVRCDMETDGGGWTVIQRRYDGKQLFCQLWESYKHGFGYPNKELWLGNDAVHLMTRYRNHTLRIDMTDGLGNDIYVEYSEFFLKSEQEGYELGVSGFSGTEDVDDLMSGTGSNDLNGKRFSTKDKDTDGHTDNCAETYGGWWMNSFCTSAQLNSVDYQDMKWGSCADPECIMVKSEMKIRPSDFNE